MIINRIEKEGDKETRTTICEFCRLAEILTRKILDSGVLLKMEPNVSVGENVLSFCITYEEDEEVLKKTTSWDVCGWYGIKTIKSFNSFALNLVCDYYGGGLLSTATIYDGMGESEIYEEILKMLTKTAEVYDAINSNPYVFVEWECSLYGTYEVHQIIDPFCGEPGECSTYEDYEYALEAYRDYVEKGERARLLLVDEEGMPIYEIKSNY